MTTKRRNKRRPDRAKTAFEEYPRMRIRWLDRLSAVILEQPGPPVATRINRTCSKLLDEIESYREGFVHALNVMKGKR